MQILVKVLVCLNVAYYWLSGHRCGISSVCAFLALAACNKGWFPVCQRQFHKREKGREELHVAQGATLLLVTILAHFSHKKDLERHSTSTMKVTLNYIVMHVFEHFTAPKTVRFDVIICICPLLVIFMPYTTAGWGGVEWVCCYITSRQRQLQVLPPSSSSSLRIQK